MSWLESIDRLIDVVILLIGLTVFGVVSLFRLIGWAWQADPIIFLAVAAIGAVGIGMAIRRSNRA